VHKRRTPPLDWRLEKASMGGGAFIDGGIHWVNVLQTLGGPFTKVSAHLISSAPMGDLTETGLSVVATLSKNAVGQLNYSWVFADYSDLKFFAVYGTEGTVYVSNTFLFMYYFGKRGHKVWFGKGDAMGFKAMWSDLLNGLKNGAPTRMTAEKGLDDLRFVEAAYQECIEGISGSSKDQKLIHNFS
jgi:predicted dehydrogenase